MILDWLIKDMQQCVNAELLFPALFVAISLPDICAGLESPNGQTSGAKYKEWYNRYLLPIFTMEVPDPSEETYTPGEPMPMKEVVILDAEDCYKFRCRLLHQGWSSSLNGRRSGITFGLSKTVVLHKVIDTSTNSVSISIPDFCNDMEDAVKAWLAEKRGCEHVESNMQKAVSINDNGQGYVWLG